MIVEEVNHENSSARIHCNTKYSSVYVCMYEK